MFQYATEVKEFIAFKRVLESIKKKAGNARVVFYIPERNSVKSKIRAV